MADTRPLSSAHFRRLWQANIVTVVGAQLTVVAVPAQIYEITGSSAYVGLTGLFGLVPLVVFGLYGGALADVMDRRTLLVVTTLGLILTSAAFWLQAALDLNNVWLLLGLFAVQQAFFAVNQPTRNAILPKLVPVDQLPAANSLEHDRLPGRRHRRSARGWRADPRPGVLVAVPRRHAHAAGHAVRGGQAAEAARGGADGTGRLAVGPRRVPLPARAPRPADVVPGRHHRHGLRHAAGAVPRGGPRRLRRPGERRPRLRAPVRRDTRGRRARRDLLRLGLASPAAGPGRHRRDRGVGPGDGRLRCRDRRSPTATQASTWRWPC